MSEKSNINQELLQILKEFVKDLNRTFPDKMNSEYYNNFDDNLVNAYEFCKETYPKHFFDILYQNEEIFNEKIELLPNIDFNELWQEDISDTTKATIWKYLQLILFSIIGELKSDESFGDTAKLFEAINQEEFKQKIEDTIGDMENLFKQNLDEDKPDISGGFPNIHNLPNAEELHEHISGMMEGKLGCLAKEIAEETANELNIDAENAESVNDVFKHLFKNPGRLMNLVKSVGSKLDHKIKSGDIKESELLEEASNLVNKMKNMPGMNNLEGMLSKMGLPGMGKGGKVDMNAFNRNMQQNLRAAKTRDRMRSKLEERTATDKTENNSSEQSNIENVGAISSKGVNQEGIEEFVFSTGEPAEKSLAVQKKKKNKRKGKKA
jgi:hypothetical protein